MIPINLYYFSTSTDAWRKLYILLNNVYKGSIPSIEKTLNRDLLYEYKIPLEAWIDLRIIEIWIKHKLPIPLLSMLNYILSIQKKDGSLSVDGIIPNSGATYRTIEFANLLGLDENKKVKKAIKFLRDSLYNYKGLPAPGPVEGAIPEIGTTARFMHILLNIDYESYEKEINTMYKFLIEKVVVKNKMAAWHTDLDKTEIKNIEDCVTGATSLALYSIALMNKLIKSHQDKELIEKVSRWLIKKQNADGGWSEISSDKSNIDNTFNVLRALVEAKPFLSEEVLKKLNISFEKANEFLNKIDPFKLETVSLKSMCLRTYLLMEKDPLSPNILTAAESIINIKDKWYNPHRHLYNEILIAGISLAEWRKKLEKNKIDVYAETKKGNSKALSFLFSIDAELSPFFSGYREGIRENILNFLTKLRCNHRFISIINELSKSITVKDILASIFATIVMLGFFFSEEFVNAIILPYIPSKEAEFKVLLTFVFILIYSVWFLIKIKLRLNFLHLFMTTIISLAIAFFLVEIWLKYSNERINGYILSYLLEKSDIKNPSLLLDELRLIILYAFLIDIGRKLIDISIIDMIFMHERKRG